MMVGALPRNRNASIDSGCLEECEMDNVRFDLDCDVMSDEKIQDCMADVAMALPSVQQLIQPNSYEM